MRRRSTMDTMRKGDQARNFRATIGKLVQHLSVYRVKIIIVAIFAVASTIFSIVGPKVLGNATTRLFEGVMAQLAGTGTIDFEYIGQILLIMFALYIFSSLFSYVMAWIMAGVSTDLTYRFRKEIAEKINRLPLSYISLIAVQKSFFQVVIPTLVRIWLQYPTLYSFTLIYEYLRTRFLLRRNDCASHPLGGQTKGRRKKLFWIAIPQSDAGARETTGLAPLTVY